MGLAYSFRGSVHYHHGRKHGSIQADMVLEKELRVLHLDLQEAKRDYVRTAYSKGNNTDKVLYRHVLRNAMIPVITMWGMTLADMLVGSIVIEQVFNIPGIGRILLTSISYRDYPVVETIIVLIAFVVIVTNFFVDVIYQLIDPRISV